MTGSILKRASASRPWGEWNDDDFDVLANGAVVGRIFKANAAPVGSPWMWTLAFKRAECTLAAELGMSRKPNEHYETTGIDGQHRGTARPLPLWRLPSGPHSPPIDPIFESGIAPRPE
jgi:hypothetical protein